MSEIKALATGLPAEVPSDAVAYLVGVLTGAEKLDRFKGSKAAYDLAGYLMSRFFGVATAASVSGAKRLSKKQLAAQLQGLTGEAQAAAVPVWLIPILFDLVKKWIETRAK